MGRWIDVLAASQPEIVILCVLVALAVEKGCGS